VSEIGSSDDLATEHVVGLKCAAALATTDEPDRRPNSVK